MPEVVTLAPGGVDSRSPGDQSAHTPHRSVTRRLAEGGGSTAQYVGAYEAIGIEEVTFFWPPFFHPDEAPVPTETLALFERICGARVATRCERSLPAAWIWTTPDP